MTETKDKGELGFRDLKVFNMARLSKQIWRLITRPNLLMSRVVKTNISQNLTCSKPPANLGTHGCGRVGKKLPNSSKRETDGR